MTEIMTLHRPRGWGLYRLGQLFDERKEKVSDSDFPPLSVTMKGIVPQLENAAKTDDGDNRKLVRIGDYVINSRSDRKGSGGISKLDGSVSTISIVLKPKGVYPRFAHHLLRSRAFQEEFYRWGHGIVADLWTTRYADMKNIRLFLPDLPTQKAIADFLDRETARIDQLIEKKQRLVEISQARFAAFREISTNAGRPTRLKHLASYVTSGSRDWGSVYADAGELFIRIGNISGASVDLDLSSRTFVDLTEKSEGQRTKLKLNDLLISITANLGSVAVVGPEAVGGYINQHVALVRLIRPELARFVAYSLQSKRSIDEFQLRGYGGTKQGLSLRDVREVTLRNPSVDVCVRVATVLDQEWSATLALVERVGRSIDRLREFRAAFITAAVTGQIDVGTWHKRGDTDRRLDAIQEEMAS